MDLPPINQLLTTLGGNAKSLPLLDEQTLTPGTTLRASVEQSTSLTPALRQALLSLLAKEATSLHTFLRKDALPKSEQPSSQGLAADQKLAQTSVNKFQQLIKQPQLFLIQLRVLGKLLTTVSPIDINKNTALNVAVRQDGQLTLNRLPDTSKQTPPIKTDLQTTTDKSARQHIQQPAAREVATQGLKQYLPKQEPLSQPLRQLETLMNTLVQHKPNAFGNDLAKLVSLLQKLQQHAPTIEQLKNPQALKQTLQSSGGFLESQLRNTARQNAPQQNSIPTTKTENILPQNSARQTQAIIPGKNAQPQITSPTPQAADKQTDNDFKADILRVLNAVQHLPNSAPTLRGSTISAVDKLVAALLSIFPNAKPQAKQTNQLQNTVSNIATPAVIAILARITSLQLRHILLRQQDGSVGPSGGFTELPIKIGEQTFPLSLHIQERFYESYPESRDSQNPQKNASKLKKRWHVFLEFDLGEHGMFASEIKVEGDSVKTDLWIEKDRLWQVSRNKLHHLQSELENVGITVETLNCHKGKAPSQEIRLQQTLVDVRT